MHWLFNWWIRCYCLICVLYIYKEYVYVYIYGYVYVFYCLIDEFWCVCTFIYIHRIYILLCTETKHTIENHPYLYTIHMYILYIYIIQHMSTDVFKNWKYTTWKNNFTTGQDGSHFLTRPVSIARRSAWFVEGYNELVKMFVKAKKHKHRHFYLCKFFGVPPNYIDQLDDENRWEAMKWVTSQLYLAYPHSQKIAICTTCYGTTSRSFKKIEMWWWQPSSRLLRAAVRYHKIWVQMVNHG